MIIATGIDENPMYWDILIAFLASLEYNSPGIRVYPYIINRTYKDFEKIDRFGCVMGISSPTINGSHWQKNYYRHEWIPEVMRGAKGPVAWVDADCLIRKPIYSIFNGVEGNKVRFWYRPEKRIQHQFQGGVYVLGYSEESLNYCELVANALKGTDDWMAPQVEVLKNIEKAGMERSYLSESFNDSKFKKGSPIWHCKHSHFNEPRFQKEFQRYLAMGKEITQESTQEITQGDHK